VVGRPCGGLSILVRSNLAVKAKLVTVGKHFIVVSLGTVLLVNVYLTTCDSTEECRSQFMDILWAVGEIIDQHSSCDWWRF